jgi:hypothetical protein
MLSHSRIFPRCFTFATIALAAIATSVEGAILTLDSMQRISVNDNVPVDLTAQGTLDWAYWAPTSATVVNPPVAPTNEKLAGNAIGSLETIGGGGLRGSASSMTVERYSFIDGTSPTSGTNVSLAGLIFNSQLGTSADGKGFQLSIAGDPSQERIVTLYLGGFQATSNLTLTLNGIALPITDSQVFTASNPKNLDVYTVRFRPDSLGDLLSVQYTASGITDATNGHVGLQAVTVAAVPEPGAASLLCLGALAWSRRRRVFLKQDRLL